MAGFHRIAELLPGCCKTVAIYYQVVARQFLRMLCVVLLGYYQDIMGGFQGVARL